MKTWGTQSQTWRDGAQMIAMAAIGLALCLLSATKASAALNHNIDLRDRLAMNTPITISENRAEFQELWFQALVRVLTEGTKNELPEGVTTYYMQKGTSFDTNVERSVQYISLATRKGVTGELVPVGVSTVSEVWTKQGDSWVVDQKIYISTVQGKLYSVIGATLVIGPDGKLVDRDDIPQAPADSYEQKQNWEAERKDWVNQILELT